MDDRHAQFLMAVGDICLTAELAGLRVEARTRDGEVARGVPSGVAARDEECVDDTGYGRHLVLDGRPLELEEIVRCTVFDPDHDRAPGLRAVDR